MDKKRKRIKAKFSDELLQKLKQDIATYEEQKNPDTLKSLKATAARVADSENPPPPTKPPNP